MKKNKKTTEKVCCCKSIFDFLKGEACFKTEKIKKYAKENPEKTRNILAVLGAFGALIIAFLINKKKNNKRKTKR